MKTPSTSLEVVILAAGQGTRMRSALPKVLHEVGGAPLLAHVIQCAKALEAGAIHVVYGHGGELVRERFPDNQLNWAKQAEQLGTGHAVAQALPAIDDNATVLVLYGDVPLIQPDTLHELVVRSNSGLALLTAYLEDAGAYGRIVRDKHDAIQRIVEAKDATPDELAINEINTGFMAAPARLLKDWISRLDNDNQQNEYYLTDVVGMAVADGIPVTSTQPSMECEIIGINNKRELAGIERDYQLLQAEQLMELGATLRDPMRFDIRGSLKCGQDVIIDVNCVVEGEVTLGNNVTLGPNVYIKNTHVADNTTILANCHIEDADIGRGCSIGPFARIRPGTKLTDKARIGNFVEIKNSVIGKGSKVNHLTYIGDCDMGADVNIGAGVITANYDGANKHRTIIGDNVSVGANNVLVAPVTVGEGATLGAGTVLRKNAPAGELTLSTTKERTISGWQRPVKKEKK